MTLHVTAFAAGIKTWASQGDLGSIFLEEGLYGCFIGSVSIDSVGICSLGSDAW
jgi:hypothetical protein